MRTILTQACDMILTFEDVRTTILTRNYCKMLRLLGNIIWLVFGGLLLAIEYFIAGLILCVTIIGIPFGLQAMKLGVLALLPFGNTTVISPQSNGLLSLVMNIIWLVLGGIVIALSHLALGLFFCITIIGIPFGLQHFKLMVVALVPFGRKIIPIEDTY